MQQPASTIFFFKKYFLSSRKMRMKVRIRYWPYLCFRFQPSSVHNIPSRNTQIIVTGFITKNNDKIEGQFPCILELEKKSMTFVCFWQFQISKPVKKRRKSNRIKKCRYWAHLYISKCCPKLSKHCLLSSNLLRPRLNNSHTTRGSPWTKK